MQLNLYFPAQVNHIVFHSNLKNSLGKAIAEGRQAPGTPIPSEHNMCRQYGISRPSLRQALQELDCTGNCIFTRLRPLRLLSLEN
jgi:DNA-binding GntR family transcriptional regulator